ncbi:hypothetical protein AB6A40_003267 [Gnathostoma spinigerum]|uniref:Uncharacterized protein n=1 Tax=Gnathostoma spinigerum TaxID=75299 RepID=A0ABD6EHX4_9BILA
MTECDGGQLQSAANKRMLRQRERRRITKSSDASRRYTVSSVQLDASASVEDSHHRTHLSPSERDSGTSQMTHSSRGRSPEKKPFLTISVPTKHSNGHRSIPRHWMDTKETSVGGGDGAISIVATNGATRNPPIHPPQNGAHKDSNVSIAFRERSSRSCSAQRGNVIYIGTDNGSVKFRDHSQRALPISPLSQKDINTNQNSPPLSQGSDCSVPEIDSKPTESPVPCTPLPPHVWPELSSPNHKSKLNADERVKKLEEKYEQINQDNLETLFLITSRNEYYPLISSETIAPSVLQRLRFSDIIFKSSAPFLVRRSAAFYEAFLPNNKDNDPSITVMITPARRYFPFASFQRVSSNRCTWSLPVLAEIEDRNRKMGQFLQESMRTSHSSYKITIMPRLYIIPFHTFASRPLQQGCSRLEHERLVSFILIQLVCALKSLQSDGIESLSSSFDEFLICYPRCCCRSLELGTPKDFEDHPRLLLLYENILDVMKEQSNQAVGVCEYALRALRTLLLTSTDNTSVNDGETSIVSTALQKCAELLPQEKSNSLTETKKLLEFAFWVGDRVKFSCEFDAQIWLDVQRARAVNHILRSKIKNSKSTVKLYEFMQTQFLLSVTHQSLFSTYSVLTHLTKESSF